jgi:hypothetical protein
MSASKLSSRAASTVASGESRNCVEAQAKGSEIGRKYGSPPFQTLAHAGRGDEHPNASQIATPARCFAGLNETLDMENRHSELRRMPVAFPDVSGRSRSGSAQFFDFASSSLLRAL